MTLKSLKSYFENSLLECYPETEIMSFFFILTEKILGKRRLDVVLEFDEIVSEIEIVKFKDSIERLKNHEPIQYIIGETEFYGLPFKVNDSVLIPRSETEELVDWIISKFRIQNSEFRITDIGTGSGCIAIALAKHLPNAKVLAIDISTEALNVAQLNAELNSVEVEFIKANILNWKQDAGIWDLEFDIIVSNPPYVKVSEKSQLRPNVLDFEPHLALFVEAEDPLLFYREISRFAYKTLRPKGQLFFEINEYLGMDIVKLLSDEGFVSIELKSDIFGKDRMIKGVKS